MTTSTDKLEALFAAAAALETDAQRAEYLNRSCPDPEQRRAVELRLHRHQLAESASSRKTIRAEPSDAASLFPHDHYVGQALDEKYRLDRLFGHGGMRSRPHLQSK